MAATDDSENLLDHLTERISPNGWRVISNPTRRPEPGADELRTLIQSMQQGRRSPGGRKVDKYGAAGSGVGEGMTETEHLPIEIVKA